MFTHFYSASILQPAEGTAKTSVHVVCCLGSLKLLEPSRISQPVPVGCSPFHSSLHFFFTFSNSLFSFFSCLSSQTASVWSVSAFVQQLLTAHLSLSSLAGCWTSLPSASLLPLSKVPLGWGFFFFVGLPKGAQRGRKLSAAHACQMCGKRSL